MAENHRDVLEEKAQRERARQDRVANALFNKSVGEQLSLRRFKEREQSLKEDPKPLKRKIKKTYGRAAYDDDGRSSTAGGTGLMRQFFTRSVNPSHTLFKRAEIRSKKIGEPIAQKMEDSALKEKQWLEKLEHEVRV